METQTSIGNGDRIKGSTIYNGLITDIVTLAELLDCKLKPIIDKIDRVDDRSRRNNEGLRIYINNNGVNEQVKKICNDLLEDAKKPGDPVE